MTRRAIAITAGLALALAAPASAAVRLTGLDASAYPTVRASVVTTKPSSKPPLLLENGSQVIGLRSENLGQRKSVVLAIDRSRSMAGRALRNAAAAARAFVAAKPGADRIAIVAFGSRAVQLTRFSTATIDIDDALRTLEVDRRQGTALNDAVVTASGLLAGEANPGRVIILLTDGRNTSRAYTQAQAVADARAAGAAVYPIAIEGPQFSPAPLRSLARATGGTYYGASSSASLDRVYRAVAAELRRTWRVEYDTAARPGDRLRLEARVPGAGSATAELALEGAGGSPAGAAPLPYGAWVVVLVGLVVGLLVFGAVGFTLTSGGGRGLRARLAPHLATAGAGGKQNAERERFAALSAVFRATERAFGHRQNWRRLQRLLERADLPLRTVEFLYLSIGCGLVMGLLAAFAGSSSFVILILLGLGGLMPYAFVWFKARRRLRAFEAQLADLLITMAASLKAGHSFKQGIQSAVEEGQEPAAKELKRVLTETRLGRSMDEALAETAERVGSKNFSFVITAVTIQSQVGGSLAGLFDMVAETVRQRQQFARKIRGLTAMGRAAAYVLIALPFFVALAITALNPSYMDPLYHSSAGHTLIVIGFVMMAIGSLFLKKIVSFRG